MTARCPLCGEELDDGVCPAHDAAETEEQRQIRHGRNRPDLTPLENRPVHELSNDTEEIDQ